MFLIYTSVIINEINIFHYFYFLSVHAGWTFIHCSYPYRPEKWTFSSIFIMTMFFIILPFYFLPFILLTLDIFVIWFEVTLLSHCTLLH